MSSLSSCIPICLLIQCHLAESASPPIGQVTDEVITEYQPQYQSLRSTTLNWLLGRHWNISHCPLSPRVWPVFMSLLVHLSSPSPPYLPIRLLSMVESVESSAKVNTHCPPLPQRQTLQHRGNQADQQRFVLLPPLSLSFSRWKISTGRHVCLRRVREMRCSLLQLEAHAEAQITTVFLQRLSGHEGFSLQWRNWSQVQHLTPPRERWWLSMSTRL